MRNPFCRIPFSLPFLSAHWSALLVANYEVPASLLLPYVPKGTELDDYQGKTHISLVAFYFSHNKFLGIIPTIPVTAFEEINLRFYVRCHKENEVRRGVVFIKEIVPSALIAYTAKALYNEPYEKHPTSSVRTHLSPEEGGSITYSIHHTKKSPIQLSGTTEGTLQPLPPDSLEEFIFEHYWGYTKQRDGSTTEYEVSHPRWKYWKVKEYTIDARISELYPTPFHAYLQSPPHSVFIAEGSPIKVFVHAQVPTTCTLRYAPPSSAKGWVLFDGRCGFCTWWIPYWEKTIQKAGFDIASLQEPWVQKTLPFPPEEQSNDIRLLLSTGELISGADAYLYGMKKVWWSAPIGYLLSLPGFRWLTWKFYKVFNRNRFLISKVCRLPPEK